mmetsp:Transcript_33230/g.56491  ORF Transcript_33230/g.56491 Transcript_33230/m.56491 type:complete len:293 (+) Transcript_33230:188-1066(+)|eukprot:CAMPEP_0183710288 /NCGR_PEP_ID=MMETSP0737-20130205/6059_1 /TAXON_ID=385413 /ORGANISM="Thalassiosira miniscula, Strain CCMP1093" /LENGTH=292 /DNA_ID=CAMNT_0025938521 /DNA_START=176 /DNA_END=1054 /DNA_ORIENTATION=-
MSKKKVSPPNLISTLLPLLAAGVAIKTGVVAGSGSSDYSSGDGEFVFSSDFLDDYCSVAQRVVAQTSLSSTNIVFEELGTVGIPNVIPSTEFIASSPLPFDGDASSLTTTQFVGFGNIEDEDGSSDDDGDVGAQTVMCKMKSGEALNYYDPGEAADGNDCTDVQEHIVELVLEGLGDSLDIGLLPPIEYFNWETFTGSQWTNGAPSPSAFIDASNPGTLVLVSKELKVLRTNPSQFLGPNKKGVHYCQTIGPEYLRNLLEGEVTAPTCLRPPVYTLPQGPPGSVDSWNCANH